MRPIVVGMVWSLALLAAAWFGPAVAQDAAEPASPRIALVVGLEAYRSAPMRTAANDAGLVAQTLAAAGFDVTAARDLDAEHLRQTFRDFLEKASAGGPRGIAFVYLAGRALQFEGDNYIVPVDAKLARDTDVPIETLRLADFTRALAATNLGAKAVVVDGAHAEEGGSARAANGLALVDPEPGLLLAFNAAPGTLAPPEAGPYGVYAQSLVRTMKQGGVPVDEVFARVKVDVNTLTRGAQVPWDASKLVATFTFFDRAPDAPASGSAQIPFASLRGRPLRDFTPEQAYDVAVARDTLQDYQDYLTAFPDNPLARRIRLLLAARREAMFWRAVLRANSAPALWTYLNRYPDGPHGAEAQRRLVRLSASRAPPPDFAPLSFDVPPPPEDEMPFVAQRFVVLDPDLVPPPPPPVFLLPPEPAEGVALPPPPRPDGQGFLPIPIPLAIPFVRPILAPGSIRPPRDVRGTYRMERPFGAAAENGRLVPRAADEVPQPAGAPAAPQPAQLTSSPAPAAEPVRQSGSGPKTALPPPVLPLPAQPVLPLPAQPVLPLPAQPVPAAAARGTPELAGGRPTARSKHRKGSPGKAPADLATPAAPAVVDAPGAPLVPAAPPARADHAKPTPARPTPPPGPVGVEPKLGAPRTTSSQSPRIRPTPEPARIDSPPAVRVLPPRDAPPAFEGRAQPALRRPPDQPPPARIEVRQPVNPNPRPAFAEPRAPERAGRPECGRPGQLPCH